MSSWLKPLHQLTLLLFYYFTPKVTIHLLSYIVTLYSSPPYSDANTLLSLSFSALTSTIYSAFYFSLSASNLTTLIVKVFS